MSIRKELLGHLSLAWPCSGRKLGVLGVLAYATALDLQSTLGLTPCPLCILQRYCLMLLIVACFMAGFGPRRGARAALGVAMTAAIVGLAVAARHVYLQSVPAQTCGPGIEYLVNQLPWTEILPTLFRGTGDCSQVEWSWHGVTLPMLSLVSFTGFVGALAISLRQSR